MVEQTVDAEYPGAVKHETVTDRLENALDEHGQLQWEDEPSGATEKAYKIRYLGRHRSADGRGELCPPDRIRRVYVSLWLITFSSPIIEMAINPNNGVLDIINGTLKVSSIDIKQAGGFTTTP